MYWDLERSSSPLGCVECKRMRGDFDNSPAHFESMGPGPLSTEEVAQLIADGLLQRTRRKWITYLRSTIPCAGSIYIEPPPERLTPDGIMDDDDWEVLVNLFGAVKHKARRWCLLPDELRTALEVLKKGPLREKGRWYMAEPRDEAVEETP